MTGANFRTVVVAVLGLALTAAAMIGWAPDAASRWPSGDLVASRAMEDAATLECRVNGEPRLFVSAGNRLYSTAGEIVAVTAEEDDPLRRRALLEAVPPVRVAARFPRAEDMVGNRGLLTLEYDGEGRWIAAEFTPQGRLAEVTVGGEFADRLAEMLLGTPAGTPDSFSAVIGSERFYRTPPEGVEPDPDRPSVYVYLGEDGTWIANLQSVSARLMTDQRLNPLLWHPVAQAQIYVLVLTGLLALVLLFWRLSRRRAGFGRSWILLALLLAGLIPTIRHYYWIDLRVLAALGLYLVLNQALVVLVWTVAEAELREARPRSVEHWDRLVYLKPIAATGRAAMAGVAYGCLLSGVLAASGELATFLGGGYGSFLTILPDYWSLPTPLNWGIALAALTALPGAFGMRLWGRPGALAGVLVSSAAWAQAMPVTPPVTATVLGLLAAVVMTLVMWRFGLLAMTVACVTGFSLPTAWTAWSATPWLLETALLSSLPLVALTAGLMVARRAPEYGDPRAAAPGWVSELEAQAKLRAEVDLLRELQLSLLPPERPCTVAGVELAWQMIPADTVGGDFLDLIEDADGRLWLVIADVAGHGVTCTTMTAFTKAAVTEHATAGVTPADAVAKVRGLFGRLRHGGQSRRGQLVTLLMATWDPRHRELSVSSAGHPPLLVYTDGKVREVGPPGHPLGVDLAGGEREERLVCRGKTVVVGYSDGAVEARSPDGELFTYERWPASLPDLAGRSAVEILQALLTEVDEHCGGEPASDDVTAVVVKI